MPLSLPFSFVEGVSSNLSSLSIRCSIAEERSFTSASGVGGFVPLVATMFVSCVSSVLLRLGLNQVNPDPQY